MLNCENIFTLNKFKIKLHAHMHSHALNKLWLCLCVSPEATSWPFWLNGHVAGATDPRGTAGARDGWHVADVTVWGLMGHIVTAPSLLLIKL